MSTPNTDCNSKKVNIDDVLLKHDGLPYDLPPFDGQVEETILKMFYYLSFVVGPLLHALKLWGGGG